MGYRLEISKVKYSTCGGKLFGYTNVEKLRSWKYLKENGYIEGDECWDYGFNPYIVLNEEEFKDFIKLYINDLKQYYQFPSNLNNLIKDLINLSKTKGNKLLEWY